MTHETYRRFVTPRREQRPLADIRPNVMMLQLQPSLLTFAKAAEFLP